MVVPPEKGTGFRVILPENLAGPAVQACIGDDPIGTLHLLARSRNALMACGVVSVRTLVNRVQSGKLEPCISGLKTVDDISLALTAISQSLQRDGVDWVHYASCRNFVILPERKCRRWSFPEFVWALPKVALAAIESIYGERESLVFRQYVMREGSSASLTRIAHELGVTRQAAALMKGSVLELLKRTLLGEDYTGCKFRFQPGFIAPILGLKKALQQFTESPLPYYAWQELLRKQAGKALSVPRATEDLILAILDYWIINPDKASFQPVLVPSRNRVPRLRAALVKSDRLLSGGFPLGLSERQISKTLGAGYSAREIEAVLDSIPGFERTLKQRRFRANLGKLSRLTDRLERILSDNGAPMPTTELAAKANSLKEGTRPARSRHQIEVALSDDPRFKPVGHSGYWALSRWKHVETRTVSDIAAELIRLRGEPVKESELYRLIRSRRRVAAESIRKLLGRDARFVRVAPLTWEVRGQPDPS